MNDHADLPDGGTTAHHIIDSLLPTQLEKEAITKLAAGIIVTTTYQPDSKPSSPSAYDDEFETAALDTDKWTAINCSPGSVDILSTAAAKDTYDPTTYLGMMALQPGRDDAAGAGPEAEAAILRQTIALDTNCKIVAKLHLGATVENALLPPPATQPLAGILLSGAFGADDDDFVQIGLSPIVSGLPLGMTTTIEHQIAGGGITTGLDIPIAPPTYLMIIKTGNNFTMWAASNDGLFSAMTDGSSPREINLTFGAGVMVRLSLFAYWPPITAQVNLPNPIAVFDWVRYFPNNTPLINA